MDNPFCFFVVIAIIVVGVFAAFQVRAREKELAEAAQRYQDHLTQLKRDPTNPNLYQRTLEVGRAYSNMTRSKKGVTVFDEVALSNDLNAARASVGSQQATTGQSSGSFTQRMQQLEDLRRDGVITEAEYQQKRQQLLDSL